MQNRPQLRTTDLDVGGKRETGVQELRAGQMSGAVSGYRGVMSERVELGETERSTVWQFPGGRGTAEKGGRKREGRGTGPEKISEVEPDGRSRRVTARRVTERVRRKSAASGRGEVAATCSGRRVTLSPSSGWPRPSSQLGR